MSNNTLSLRSIVEKENRLNGSNFTDWHRNLRIVLKSEKKLYVLDQPVPALPLPVVNQEQRDAYQKYLDDADAV